MRCEHPIPFSGPMVRAILEGRKTQTRRVLKPQPVKPSVSESAGYPSAWYEHGCIAEESSHVWICPYGVPGHRLWVREGVVAHASIPQVVGYAADGCKRTEEWEKYRNSRYMPRWASRITLEITEVRVQRVQEISEEDARAEGCTAWKGVPGDGEQSAVESFRRLWDSLNAQRGYGWEENPWVWAITFKRIERSEKETMK